jgi:hypothetical protein
MKQDRTIVCIACHEEFLFPVRDQEFFGEHGWKDPIRCRKCQKLRKDRYARDKYGTN